MICCDRCGKKINKFAEAKMTFHFTETSEDFTKRQEHDMVRDICMDCQIEILQKFGIPFILTFPENREKYLEKNITAEELGIDVQERFEECT